jgi:hypothetical protein
MHFLINKGPTFFAKLIFSRRNFFFGILEKGNLFEQKKFWREKINLAKTILPLIIISNNNSHQYKKDSAH